MAYSDFDNDGDVDLLSIVLNVPVNEEGWQTVLNRNEWGNQKNWFQVSLEGIEANRDAYGSRVLLYAGEEILLRESSGGSSHCSHSSSRLHFGLDDIPQVDSIQVWWTGGQRLQTVYDLEANQHIRIVEDTTIAPITSSLIPLAKSDKIKVYPNPSSGQLFVEMQDLVYDNTVDIQLVNGLGQVQKRFLNIKNRERMVLDVEMQPAGVYYILIRVEGRTFVKKIILE